MDFQDTDIQADSDCIDNWLSGAQLACIIVAAAILLLVSGCGGSTSGMDGPVPDARSTTQPTNCTANPSSCK